MLRVSLSVDVATWNAEYGSAESRQEIRESIRSAIAASIDLDYRHLGAGFRVEDVR
jgi:hypothetical protein